MMVGRKGRSGRKKKPAHTRVGTKYWQHDGGSPRRYTLYQVTTKGGGVRKLSPHLTKKEARLWVQGYNKRVGRGRGRLRSP